MEVTAARVRQFLVTRYFEPLEGLGLIPGDIPDDFDFLLNGVIDSVGILEMISAIEEEFGMQLDLEALDAEKITIIGPLSCYAAENAMKALASEKPAS
jgi:acyl carrier protein